MTRYVPTPPRWHVGLTTVGVTGTDGKTSTVAMIASALGRLGGPVARITSLGAYLGEQPLPVPRKYPGLLAAMRAALGQGGRHAVVEWASWALANGFIESWPCRFAVLTNVTRDHLDYHGSFDAYLASKGRLFAALPRDGAAIINASDPSAAAVRDRVPQGVRVVRYGRHDAGDVDVRLLAAEPTWSGTAMRIQLGSVLDLNLRIRMIGVHFAENAMAALGTILAMEMDVAQAAEAIAATPPPPGRFEVVSENPHVVVDFAHTPNGLTRTLETARTLATGKVTVVFGAGGGRDAGKRELLGAAAGTADRIVVTTDNPRDEDPGAIIAQVRVGVPAGPLVEEEPDRAEAIRRAVIEAADTDVVVVAGRGRDTHQLVRGEWVPMDDAAIAREAIRTRERRSSP